MDDDMFKENDSNCEMFYNDINAKIEYHLQENDLTYAEVIGTLEILKQEILNQMYESVVFEIEMDDEDEEY